MLVFRDDDLLDDARDVGRDANRLGFDICIEIESSARHRSDRNRSEGRFLGGVLSFWRLTEVGSTWRVER